MVGTSKLHVKERRGSVLSGFGRQEGRKRWERVYAGDKEVYFQGN